MVARGLNRTIAAAAAGTFSGSGPPYALTLARRARVKARKRNLKLTSVQLEQHQAALLYRGPNPDAVGHDHYMLSPASGSRPIAMRTLHRRAQHGCCAP